MSTLQLNIRDMAEVIGEESLNELLSDFFPKNLDIERFNEKNALNFARRKISVVCQAKLTPFDIET